MTLAKPGRWVNGPAMIRQGFSDDPANALRKLKLSHGGVVLRHLAAELGCGKRSPTAQSKTREWMVNSAKIGVPLLYASSTLAPNCLLWPF